MRRFSVALLSLFLMGLLTACGVLGGEEPSSVTVDGGSIPNNAIEISIIYAPESDEYMQTIIPAFNQSYRDGINPVTGERLTNGERPIYVTGESGSSGVIATAIVNTVRNPNSPNTVQPTIFQPSVSHWLALANFESGREIFDLQEARATALAPVVMAIWQSRLEAIQNTVGYDEIGWDELLAVLDSPNGWRDYGIPDGRRTVYYGHTDPFVSSTALSTLIAEYYAAARVDGFTGRRIGLTEVNNPDVQQGVRDIEQLIRHYSRRTTEFRNYIAQGPEYLDFVALEENDLIAINRGLTTFKPPEPLIALYPKEGTFWHEHPFGILDAPWVNDDQAQAARTFTDYVLLPEQQQLIMSFGFRPANNSVPVGFPIEAQFGVDVNQPTTLLDVPAPEVISEIQNTWRFVKKQADIMLLIDISGSMNEQDKLKQAKQAALAFIDSTESTNRVGLAVFSSEVRVLLQPAILEDNRTELRELITGLQADGGTALYESLVVITNFMGNLPDSDRIRAVVLLSDGEDTSDGTLTVDDAVTAIENSRDARNPIIVVPVGYGRLSTQLERVLSDIADASNTIWVPGDPDNIQSLLELISSFF